MSLRTFYIIVTEDKEYEHVESFREENGFLRFEFYPDIDMITSDIFRLEPETRYIPKESLLEVKTVTRRV